MCLSRLLLKGFFLANKAVDNKRLKKQKLSEGVTVTDSIPYIEGSDGIYHTLEILYPSDATKPLPVILEIHGGGWMYGTKELNRIHASRLAAHGFAVVNISYRLAPKVSVKEQIQDIFAAIEWLKNNADKYPCDLNNLFVTGDSAGGHLTMLSTLVNGAEQLRQKFEVQESGLDIKAIGLNCASLDLEFVFRLRYIPLAHVVLRSLLGKKYMKCAYKDDISFKNSIKNNKFPPIYMVTSKQDFLQSNSVAFAKLLEESGADYKLTNLDKVKTHSLPHVYSVRFPDYEESKTVNKEMCDFFRKYMLV